MRRSSAACFAIVLGVSLVACGGDDTPPAGVDASIDGGGAVDLGTADGRVVCTSDVSCNDGLFCNGREVCAPASPMADVNGCVPGDDPCSDGETCSEEENDCRVTCEDVDGDGHEAIACGGDDCVDDDASRFPGNDEVCDTDDEDCNDSTFGFVDADADGVSSSACCNGTACGTDCNDGNADIRPGALDGPPDACNAIDDDCDGFLDEGCPCTSGTEMPCYTGAPSTRGVGRCTDGFQLCVDGMPQLTCTNQRLPDTEICDTLDNDCDGMTNEDVLRRYYRDGDADGFGLSTESVEACSPPMGFVSSSNDCNDDDNNRNPGAFDACNGVDDDCDTMIDEGAPPRVFHRDADGDGFGSTLASMMMSACDPPAGYVVDGTDCDDANSARHPGAFERCDAPVAVGGASIDDDCDMAINEGCACSDGVVNDCGPARPAVGACVTGTQVCVGGVLSACAGAVASRAETCNGRDDDCDGTTDNGFLCAQGATRAGSGAYLMCASIAGLFTCNATCTAEAFSGSAPPEMCDAVDNNCNGVADDGFACVRSSTGNGCTTSCGTVGTYTCSATCTAGTCRAAAETCNGCDDDGTGGVDNGFACVLGATRACTTACGTAGTQRCLGDCGGYDACRATTETCNGCDDDLDGAADDGFTCERGRSYSCTTACGTAGQLLCNTTCGGYTTATCAAIAETCNYCDDDGDGTASDEAYAAGATLLVDADACSEYQLFGSPSDAATCGSFPRLISGTGGGLNQVGAMWARRPMLVGYDGFHVRVTASVLPCNGTDPDVGWALVFAENSSTSLGVSGGAGAGVPSLMRGLSVAWKFFNTAPGGVQEDHVDLYMRDGVGGSVYLGGGIVPLTNRCVSSPLSLSQTQVLDVTYLPARPELGRLASITVKSLDNGGPAAVATTIFSVAGGTIPIWPPGTLLRFGMTAATGTSTAAILPSLPALQQVGVCDAPYDGQVRIAGGTASGRLEVFHSGQWGSVCEDSFAVVDANIACRQLGYGSGTVRTDVADGADPIWLDDLGCAGTELGLGLCAHPAWGTHNCTHARDVGVTCVP